MFEDITYHMFVYVIADGILSNVADIIPKPFSERTVTEKDQLYERIADQLAAIADHYNFGSSSSRKNRY